MRPVREADNLNTIMCRMSWKSRRLNLENSRPHRAWCGTLIPPIRRQMLASSHKKEYTSDCNVLRTYRKLSAIRRILFIFTNAKSCHLANKLPILKNHIARPLSSYSVLTAPSTPRYTLMIFENSVWRLRLPVWILRGWRSGTKR